MGTSTFGESVTGRRSSKPYRSNSTPILSSQSLRRPGAPSALSHPLFTGPWWSVPIMATKVLGNARGGFRPSFLSMVSIRSASRVTSSSSKRISFSTFSESTSQETTSWSRASRTFLNSVVWPSRTAGGTEFSTYSATALFFAFLSATFRVCCTLRPAVDSLISILSGRVSARATLPTIRAIAQRITVNRGLAATADTFIVKPRLLRPPCQAASSLTVPSPRNSSRAAISSSPGFARSWAGSAITVSLRSGMRTWTRTRALPE